MEDNMAEFQPSDPRNSRKLFIRALHNDPILVKVHVAAHIGNIADYAFFKDNDLHFGRTFEVDLVIFDKRQRSVFPETVLIIAICRVS